MPPLRIRHAPIQTAVLLSLAATLGTSGPACAVYDRDRGSDGACDDALGGGLSDEHVVEALAVHELTEAELADVTAFWIFMLVAADKGEFDRSFVDAEFDVRLLEIAEPYAGITQEACDDAPRTSSRNAVLDGELTCESDCSSAHDDLYRRVVTDLALEYLNRALRPLRGGEALQAIYSLFYELKTAVENARAAKTDVREAIRAALAGKDTGVLLRAVAEATVAAGSFAGVAGLLGVAVPALAVIQAVTAAVGAVLLVLQFAADLRASRDAERACIAWQAQHCAMIQPNCEDVLIAAGLPSCCWCQADYVAEMSAFDQCVSCRTSPGLGNPACIEAPSQPLATAVAECCAMQGGQLWSGSNQVSCN